MSHTLPFSLAGCHFPGSRPLSSEADFLRHFRTVLPEAYVAGRDFSTYVENLRKSRTGQPVSESPLPFYG